MPIFYILLTLIISLFSTNSLAHQDFSKVDIKTQKVADNIYMLMGEGGNIAISVGEDGVLIIDDQFAPLAKKIQSAIKTLSNKPIGFVINTHWHGDHTGGNEAMAKNGATIVAHENVRKRLQSDQFIKAFNIHTPASPKKALPVVTFKDGLTFHWNNQTIEVKHIASAHTDGDAIIHFKEANVIHAGDLYFNDIFPFIDPDTGGSITGVIAGVKKLLALSNEKTKIIPGHGALSNRTELEAYRDMLITAHTRLKTLKEQGKSVEEIVKAKPLADLNAKWGDGFIPMDKWIRIILDGMKTKK